MTPQRLPEHLTDHLHLTIDPDNNIWIHQACGDSFLSKVARFKYALNLRAD